MTETPRSEPIEARVALVLDEREVLLDKGPSDGIELGMRFTILGSAKVKNQAGEEFTIGIPKRTVKIVRFDNEGKNAVGRTFKTIKGTPRLGSLAATIAQLETHTPDRVETLPIAPETANASKLRKEDVRIKEGDRAAETRGNEYD